MAETALPDVYSRQELQRYFLCRKGGLNVAGPRSSDPSLWTPAVRVNCTPKIGYSDPVYAQSLTEWGQPMLLPQCGGWLFKRPIPGFDDCDAMGTYPYFSCRDWSMISQDIQNLNPDLVSIALATDPFGDYDEALLNQCFDGAVRRWKRHYVIDLRLPIDEIGSKSRRKFARRALNKLDVGVVSDPAQWLDEWVFLYSQLVQRHKIFGLRAFSKSAFMKQLAVPGVVILQAKYREKLVGALMYYIDGDVVHCHLGATSSEGYSLGVTDALDQFSITHFADRARWLNLGGGLASSTDKLDGLSYYKKGWATDTRWSYFCGHVINRERYDSIVNASGVSPTSYFPAYRKGEYG